MNTMKDTTLRKRYIDAAGRIARRKTLPLLLADGDFDGAAVQILGELGPLITEHEAARAPSHSEAGEKGGK